MASVKLWSPILVLGLPLVGIACEDPGDPADDPTLEPIVHIELLGEALHPEGIAAHPGTGELFVGGLATGEIQRIAPDGTVSQLVPPGDSGLLNVIGLAVDPRRDRLHACSTSFFDPLVPPSLVVFDATTGELLGSFSPPDDGLPHFFNDVTVDEDGNAFVTDSLAHVIWRLDDDLTGLTSFASDPAFIADPTGFNLNGIVAVDGALIAVVPTLTGTDGRLFRVELDDGTVSLLDTPPSFGGVDGLVALDDDRLLGVGGVPGITSITLRDDEARIEALPTHTAELDLPTTGAILDGRLWIVNSQLDHFVPLFPDHGTPPEPPFTVTGIALEALLEQ